jgi:NarL family two-component system sensor histidine kinase LiaS
MSIRRSLATRFRQLRWKLTLSYTGVTVAALLAVELVLYGISAGTITVLINSGFLAAQLIESTAADYAWELRPYLTASPPDEEGIANWLERIRPPPGSFGFNIDKADGLLVVGSDTRLLAVSPPDFLGPDAIGQPLDPQAIPGLAHPLRAALAGEADTERLYTVVRPDNQFVMAVPVWDAAHERVLGVLVASVAIPQAVARLRELVQILGISLLPFMLVAGLIGTAFGYLAARGLVLRLGRLAEATRAWSRGDFTVLVDDPAGDEVGQLARRLNGMAEQLQNLLDTRRALAIVDERNRLARDLHDSAKQQAFAVAAQLGAARATLKGDPEAADAHIAEAERLAYDLRQELTHLIEELRPAALGDRGLVTVVRAYAADWSRHAGIEVDVRVQGERALPLEIEQALFRIAQEALANVARHSQANRVEICLTYDVDAIALAVIDDGRGFDVDSTRGGVGLQSMQERAASLAGRTSIESVPGEGTRISCVVPIDRDGEGTRHG